MKNPVIFSSKVQKGEYYHLEINADGREELAIICGGREYCRPDYVVQRKTFRFMCIEFVAAGKGILRLAGKSYPLIPGTIFSYGPGRAHRIATDPAEPMTKYFIVFTGTEAGGLVATGHLADGPLQVAEPYRLESIMDEIAANAVHSGPHCADICRLLLRLLPLAADDWSIAVHGPRSRAALSFKRCKAIIDRRFMELYSLRDVADACGLDPGSVCRLFKRFGRVTPYQYLSQRRMRRAADLLLSDDKLVKEVHAEMGYSDPYHFSRAFKRVHGLSPRQFIELMHRRDGQN